MRQQISMDGNTTKAYESTVQNLEKELKELKRVSKNRADKWTTYESELTEQNNTLTQVNHRIQQELSTLQQKFQDRIRGDKEKDQEIQRFRNRILELEALYSREIQNARNNDRQRQEQIDRIQLNLSGVERSLDLKQSMMNDLEFFVGIRNAVDEYVEESSAIPQTPEKYVDPIPPNIPGLRCKSTFEAMLENDNLVILPELTQKLTREVDEDKSNFRHALHELSNRENLLVSHNGATIGLCDGQNAKTKQLVETLEDVELQLQESCDKVGRVTIFGDSRDDHHADPNHVLTEIRDSVMQQQKDIPNRGVYRTWKSSYDTPQGLQR